MAGATRCRRGGSSPAGGQADFLLATFFDDPVSDFFVDEPESDFVLAAESELLESELFDSPDGLEELSDFSLLRRDDDGLSVL